MSSGNTDLYALLGVGREASADEIKRAYRKLARQYHPDVSNETDAEQRFKEINLAYEVLSDPQKRQQYDTFGTTGGPNGRSGDPFGGAGFGSINDIFEFFFGGSGGMGGFSAGTRRGRGGTPGDDIRRATHLKLVDVLEIKQVSFQIERREPCDSCHGSGAEPGSQPASCQTCGGQGQVLTVRDTLLGRMQTVTTCPHCHGEGSIVSSPCKACKGTGHQYKQRSIDVSIPSGIEDGNILRVSGQGHCGRGAGYSGDLLVEISVEPDSRFQRRGADLLTALEVPYHDLVLGATVQVPTLTGDEPLRIPAGTPSHHEFILRGHGLPRLRGNGRGNLHVLAQVAVPHRPGKRERELLEEMRRLQGDEATPAIHDPGQAASGRGLFKRRNPKG